MSKLWFFASQHEQFDFLLLQRHIARCFKAGNRWNLADAITGKKWKIFFYVEKFAVR
jgi:hypothetical protein